MLCSAIAQITDDFSFAYLKEAFVSTLLAIANSRSDEDNDDDINGGGDSDTEDDDDDDEYDHYELWREMKKQVKILRDDMDAGAEDEDSKALSRNHGAIYDLPPGPMGSNAETAVALTPFDALKRDMATMEGQNLPQLVDTGNSSGMPEFFPDGMLEKIEA